MSFVPALRRGLLVAVLLAFISLPAASAIGATNGYGELTRFGERTSGGREAETEAGHLSEARTLELGVDPTDNSVYVLEEKKRESISGKQTTRFFRLKKFKANAGKYSETAHVDFEETSPHLRYDTPLEEEEKKIDHEVNLYEGQKPGVNGLVVEPENGGKPGRVYLLLSDLREEDIAIDSLAAEHKALRSISPGIDAASALYAFSTAEKGGSLVPAEGTKEGVLTPATTFLPQSTSPGRSLLEPSGIALDPATHEVIVLAHEDTSGSADDELISSSDHYVLQRVKANGELGERYVDTNNSLKETTSEALAPTSPVVVAGAHGAESEEKLLVDFEHELYQLPMNFSSTEGAKALSASAGLPGREFEQISHALSGPGTHRLPAPEERERPVPADGRLTVSPEGTVFGIAPAVNEREGHEGREAVLALSGATGERLGWTGAGVSEGSGANKNRCVAEPYFALPSSQVAAGKEGDVFVLGQEFLRKTYEEEDIVEEGTYEVFNPETGETEEEELEVYGEPEFLNEREATIAPAITEFGPGGSGCPEASAEGPEAEINGTKGVHEAPPASEVRFTSTVKQADALKVEWVFEPVSEPSNKEVVVEHASELGGGQPLGYRAPSVTHRFTRSGEYHVVEKIYDDDLANATEAEFSDGQLMTPSITLAPIAFTVKPGPPEARFIVSPGRPSVGQEATFESKSSDPNGAKMEYTWSFGDGATSGPSASPIAKHAYAATGSYRAKLTIKDSLGYSASAEQTLSVSSEEGGGGGGGGCTAGCSCTGTCGSPGPEGGGGAGGGAGTGGGNGGTGGVLSYHISVPAAVSVSASGALSVKVSCGGQSSCKGTLALKTLSAVLSGSGKHKKKQILTLASGTFTLAGGQSRTIVLHLSAAARALLAASHQLRVHAIILARDYAGHSHTNTYTLTLKLAKHKK